MTNSLIVNNNCEAHDENINKGDGDDKPIPPKGEGSRAALAIGASVPFADKDNGEEFKIIYSLLSSSFRQTLNNQQNLHQFHFHLKKASLCATPP